MKAQVIPSIHINFFSEPLIYFRARVKLTLAAGLIHQYVGSSPVSTQTTLRFG